MKTKMKALDNKKSTGLSIDFGDELSKNLTIYKNVNQDIIVTTEDKIKLVLIETKESLTAQRDLWTPLGLLISFIATFVTADFKDTLGFVKEFWKAIFVILTMGSSIWLIFSVIKLIKNWNKATLEKIIEKIKIKDENPNDLNFHIVNQKRTITNIPFTNNWEINHWGKGHARIQNNKMIFECKSNSSEEDGSHIDLKGTFEIGKTYEVSCYAKSLPNTEGKLQLWLHDNVCSQPTGVDVKTDFLTPSLEGEVVKISFSPQFNRDLRIHLQYKPGKGLIEVDQVDITEIETIEE